MSLSKLNTTKANSVGVPIHIKNWKTDEPLFNGKDKPVRIFVRSISSDEAVAVTNANADAARERKLAGVEATAADNERETRAFYVALTAGWENVPQGWVDNSTIDAPIEYSPEVAAQMFANRGMATWLIPVYDEVAVDRARFLTD